MPPPAAPSVIAAPAIERFSSTFVEAIKRARRDLLGVRLMLVEPTPLPDRLGLSLLYAESAVYLGDEAAGRRDSTTSTW